MTKSDLKSKIERSFFPTFYLITGVSMFLIWIWENLAPPHIPFIGTLSLIAFYSLGKMKRWCIYPVTILFFSGITFGVTTSYAIMMQFYSMTLELLVFQLMIIAYLVILSASFFYILAKRKKLG